MKELLFILNAFVAFIFLMQGVWGLSGIKPPKIYYVIFLIFVAAALAADIAYFIAPEVEL